MVSRKLPLVVSAAEAFSGGDCADTPCRLERASIIPAARQAGHGTRAPRIAADAVGLVRGAAMAGKLPQILVELAQQVLGSLGRSALHDQTLQLGPLFLDPLAGCRHPFLDAVGADGLCHDDLQAPAPQRPSRPLCSE